MSSGPLSWGREKLRAVRRFFGQTVWETNLDELESGRAKLYGAARIVAQSAERLFLTDALHMRAAALTYFTVLSLVPLLAFAFALLKGFGAYDALIEESIRPRLLEMLSGNPGLRESVAKILGFVENTGVASLGFIGLVTLLYAATRLLRNIEAALNHIWGAQSGRGPLRQLTDYLAIIVVTPICMMLAAGLTTVSQVSAIIRFVQDRLGLGALLEWLLGTLAPVGVVFAGLVFLYAVMPNTGVRARSAVLGAAVGSVLWYAALILHVRFQVGVARFNALYSGFGAFPIFLVWVQVSWLVVMIGAQVAATHQQNRNLAQRWRIDATSKRNKEVAWLAAVLEIAQAFVRGERSPELGQLSRSLGAPEPLVREGLERLVREGLLAKASDGAGEVYVLARDPESIHIKQLLDALRELGPTPSAQPKDATSPSHRHAATLLVEFESAQASFVENRHLRELVSARPPHDDSDSAARSMPNG